MISGNFRKGKACKHGGVCMNESLYPFEMFCDCTGTGYHGDLCEIDDCINCNGNQTCTEIDLLAPNNATCECKGLFATVLDSLSYGLFYLTREIWRSKRQLSLRR